MAVDHRFHFFGIYLQPADIDDAAGAAGEVTALAALLDHVAGIDPAILHQRLVAADIARGGARRTDMQGAIHDLHLHRAVAVQERGGKTFQPVGDFKAHAGFGGGIGMADGSSGKRAFRLSRTAWSAISPDSRT